MATKAGQKPDDWTDDEASNGWNDELSDHTDDEDGDPIARYMFRRIQNLRNEEVADDTDSDEESDDEEFKEALRLEEARMNDFAFHFHLA